jgi:TRAP-type C4-dicarboxylate transport system substrate-binding protein
LAIVPGLADLQVEAFQDELATRGKGGVDLVFSDDFDVQHTLGSEQDIVRAVADGRLDLGWVGARAFRELGVHDLDPLVAPMVLDSLAAQEAVLLRDVPRRMMDGLEPIGVTGLAVLGGALRRPVAAEEPLTTLADFRGLAFYSWHGAVNQLAITALGSTNVDVDPETRNQRIADGSIGAFENTLAFPAANADWRTNTMTVKLNLWPSVSVLVANPARLAALTKDQLSALTSAAEATASRALDLLADEGQLAASACRAGATLAVADAADLAEIEAALEPIRRELRRDPVVAGHLDKIADLTRGLPPDTLTIPDGCEAATPKE